MGRISKDILVIDLENYKPEDATFVPNENRTHIDGIRNYFGLHQTDSATRASGIHRTNYKYNGVMEYEFHEPQWRGRSDQLAIVHGGEYNLKLRIRDPSPNMPRTAGVSSQYLYLSPTDRTSIDRSDRPDNWSSIPNPSARVLNEPEIIQQLEAFDEALQSRMMGSTLGRMENGQVFYDHTFIADAPYTKEELNASNVTIGTSFYEASPKYGYYEKNYENIISEEGMDTRETLLPNMYAFVSNAQQDPDNRQDNRQVHGNFQNPADQHRADPIYRRLITLGGHIQTAGYLINQDDPEDVRDVAETTKVQEYLKSYYQALKRGEDQGWIDEPNITALADSYKESIFSGDSKRILTQAYRARNAFPMHNLLSFSTNQNVSTVGPFAKQGVTKYILSRMQNTPAGTAPSQVVIKSKDVGVGSESRTRQRERERDRYGVLVHPEGPAVVGVDSTERQIKVYDLNPITTILSPLSSGPPYEGVFYKETPGTEEDPMQLMIDNLTSNTALAKTYSENSRTYIDILSGKTAYNEVLAYKIEKYSTIDPSAPDPISTTFIPNQSELEVMNYVDTQVKYNEPYRYVVKQLVVVYGSKITFNRLDTPHRSSRDPGEFYEYGPASAEDNRLWVRLDKDWGGHVPEAQAMVQVTADLKLYEIPYFTTREMRIVVTPPSPPEIELVPYKGIDNKILININNSLDEYIDYPVILDDTDTINVQNVQNMQNDVPPGKIRFSGRTTGTEIDHFIIYRTKTRPSSYGYFSRALQRVVGTSIEGLKSSGASFLDAIDPNIKYYYIVRTVDVHGFRSNPSAVFELEMVSNSGTIYPIIKTVKVGPENDGRMMSRSMRKFIQIKPSFLQTSAKMDRGDAPMGSFTLQDMESPEALVSNGDWSNNFDSFIIGGAQQTIWHRSFKVRFTSKQTGKKLDLNLTFRLRRDNS